jgi:hypothetical protein
MWDGTKNGAFTPSDVVPGSMTAVWWRCGKGPDHAWKAPVAWVAKDKCCPFCFNLRVSVTNSLATVAPRVARHLHPTKNGSLSARDLVATTNRQVWWLCDKDPRHVWKGAVSKRVRNGDRWRCVICDNLRLSPTNSLAYRFPPLAAQWHPRKNGKLTPASVTAAHSSPVWWKCAVAPDHQWQAPVNRRMLHPHCPFCSGRRAAASNCLATTHPRLSRLWHRGRNRALRPEAVTARSYSRLWWRCPRGADHEWEARVVEVVNTNGFCRFCAGRAVSVTNSLATLFPKVARQWNRARNGPLAPADVLAASNNLAWWRCALGHEWRARIRERTVGGKACPACAEFGARLAGRVQSHTRLL